MVLSWQVKSEEWSIDEEMLMTEVSYEGEM